ncbi:MAG: hypothetical protein ABJP34_05915 [Erythrobacter sp.]
MLTSHAAHRSNSSDPSRKTSLASVPAFALAIALAVLAAATPVSVAAHSERDTGAKVNTQFLEERSGEESGRLVIRNTSILPRIVYARFQMPDDPSNRNYGFYQTIAPLSSIAYDLPVGVRVFACDGKYWDNYRPDEALAVTIEKAGFYRFTHSQFKPTALRRAR